MSLDIGLLDGLIEDRGERCDGAVELPGEIREDVVRAHSAGVCVAAPLQALNCEIPEREVRELSRARRCILRGESAPDEKGVGSVPAEVVLSGSGNLYSGRNGAAGPPQILDDRRRTASTVAPLEMY